MLEADATWEILPAFHQAYPTFELEDKLFVQGGSGLVILKDCIL